MAEDTWVEDRRYVMSSIDDIKEDIKELKSNDGDMKTTLAVMQTKILAMTFMASSIIGVIMSVLMKSIGG
jgi:hypothetical protein